MAVWDVHQHLWPEPLVAALRARRRRPRLVGDTLELGEGTFAVDSATYDLDERLRLLERHEVDVAVVSLPPTLEADEHPELRDAYHEGMAEAVAHSHGRLRAFAAGECLEGFVGACVSAATLLAGTDELARELERTGKVLFVHPGPPQRPPRDAPRWWTAVVDYTAQMQAAYAAWSAGGAARFPDLRVVFALLAGGSPFQLERLAARGGDATSGVPPNVYLETSSYGPRALELCLVACGADRILFGSDAPVVELADALQVLDALDEDVADLLGRRNPERLLA